MQLRRKQDIARLIYEIKVAAGCARCTEADPCCLVFHHRDPKTKKFEIAWAFSGKYGLKTVLAEVAKCDVLCMNCHLKHHWEERQRAKAERDR